MQTMLGSTYHFHAIWDHILATAFSIHCLPTKNGACIIATMPPPLPTPPHPALKNSYKSLKKLLFILKALSNTKPVIQLMDLMMWVNTCTCSLKPSSTFLKKGIPPLCQANTSLRPWNVALVTRAWLLNFLYTICT